MSVCDVPVIASVCEAVGEGTGIAPVQAAKSIGTLDTAANVAMTTCQ